MEAGRVGEQRGADSPDFACGPTADQPAAGKTFDTLRTVLASKGFALRQVDAGEQTAYIASRWNQSRTLPDLAAVEGFARQVGAQP